MSNFDDLQSLKYPLLQTLLYDTCLMIEPSKADIIHHVLQGYAMGQAPAVDAAAFQKNAERKPYQTTAAGVAVIRTHGTLVHRGGSLDALSGMTGYNRISLQLKQADNDQDVKAVLLDVDSPGGSVAGLFELAKEIQAIDKPVWAMSNENMFSAAYAIGASADRVFASQTAMAGSIGVIMMHLDQSKANEKAGKKYTPIYAGHHKIDGSSHAPLSDQARASYQNIVDQNYDIFANHVAQGRDMDVQAVIDTQAQIYTAKDALEVGLIDQIANFDETLNLLEAEIRPTATFTRATAHQLQETEMSDKDKPGDKPVITQADLDAAQAKGVTEGQAAERTRVDGILAHDKAGANFQMASSAISTGMTLEQANGVLSAMPDMPEASSGGQSQFDKQMEGLNPDINADSGNDTELTDAQFGASIVSLVQPQSNAGSR